jgi:lipopolysaccharide transport system permease protein
MGLTNGRLMWECLSSSMKKKVRIIKPNDKVNFFDFSEIFKFRDLFYILSWRDIKVRYKQTMLGVAWAVLQPVATMVIFTVFFGNLAKIPSGNLPYSFFVLCGLVFWYFFSSALSNSSDSMVENEQLIKKVYFPKVILPLSSIVTSGVDFAINLSLLIIFALILKIHFFWNLLVVIPIGVLLTIFTAGGMGLFLSSFNVKYRDVRYILPFFIQLMMFLTPVIYPLNILSPRNRWIMALNPMSSVIESIRLAFSNGNFINTGYILMSFASSIVIFILGYFYFRRTEKFFADVV